MIDAEIVCRRIELQSDKDDRRKPCTQLNMNENRDFLRVDQIKMLGDKLKARNMKALVAQINGR